jgi:hypothetical protein
MFGTYSSVVAPALYSCHILRPGFRHHVVSEPETRSSPTRIEEQIIHLEL